MLSATQLGRLLDELRKMSSITADAEITLEAAPGSFARELAEAWQKCGVNRVSLGVQSFVERELKAVGRSHRAETVAADVASLRAAGIANVSLDLIAGLPPSNCHELGGFAGLGGAPASVARLGVHAGD